MNAQPNQQQMETAATMFSALADVHRLKTLVLLAKGGLSVSAIAAAEDEKLSTVSARLQILHAARLISRQRQGKSIIYRLADAHVLQLIENAIDHACEPEAGHDHAGHDHMVEDHTGHHHD